MAQHHDHRDHETGIRTVFIRGVAVSISHQKGALLIWGKPEHKGKSVELRGRRYATTASACFVEHTKNGRRQYVAVFSRLDPAEYETGYFSDHSYVKISISPDIASQLDWS